MKQKVRVIGEWDKTNIGEGGAKVLEEMTLEYLPQSGDLIVIEELGYPMKIICISHNLKQRTVDIIVKYNPKNTMVGRWYTDFIGD